MWQGTAESPLGEPSSDALDALGKRSPGVEGYAGLRDLPL